MRNKRISGLSALLLAVGLAVPASLSSTTAASAVPSTIYVDPGNPTACDDNGPGTVNRPFCAIQPAVNFAQPGQTVQVNGLYSYVGEVDVNNSGTPGNPITITVPGSSARRGWIRSTTGRDFVLTGVHDIVLHGFTATDQQAVVLQDSQRVTVSGFNMSSYLPAPTDPAHQGSAITLQGATTSDVAITGNRLANHALAAVSIGAQVQRTTVNSNLVIGNGGGGVLATGASGTVVAGNTFTANCQAAIQLTGTSTNSTVENNILSGDNADPATTGKSSCPKGPAATFPEIAVASGSTAGTTVDYNLVNPPQGSAAYTWSGTSYSTPAAFAATGNAAHDLAGDPKFVSGTDQHLQASSPAIDSADAAAPGATTTDFAGNPRVDDSDVANSGSSPTTYTDRGAYEFQDPMTLGAVTGGPVKGPYPLPVTATVAVTNPWNTQASYLFDFGDGTKVQSSTPTATHTYTSSQISGYPSYYVSATATLPGGVTRTSSASLPVEVDPPGPILPWLAWSRNNRQSPLYVDISTGAYSPWPVTSATLDFGDGSPRIDVPPTSGNTVPTSHTYPKPGTYTLALRIADSAGRTSLTTQQFTVGSAFVPYGPVRFLDTRYGIGAPRAQLGPGGVVRLKVTGVGGVPAAGVTSVTLNVTDAGATASSWITAYPDGSPRPNASNLNFHAWQANPNLVTVPVGADGYVDLYNANGRVDLFADVQGYTTTQAAAGEGFVNTLVDPTRVLDTRTGIGARAGTVGPDGTVTLRVPDLYPHDVSAVLLNVTATGADANSWVTVYPGGTTRPNASNLNFHAGQTTPNLVVVPVGADGTVTFYNHSGHVNLFADVEATISPSTGTVFFPVTPARVLDTRYGSGAPQEKVQAGQTLQVTVAGTHGVPADATAVVLNLTATGPTANTWITAFYGGILPNVSSLNVAAGTTRPNLVVVPIGPNGTISLYNAHGQVDLFADVQGYYLN